MVYVPWVVEYGITYAMQAGKFEITVENEIACVA